MTKRAFYDQKSYDIAEAFLEDEPHLNTEKRRDELAQEIQRTIENFIAYEQANYEPADPMRHVEFPFAANH